MSDEGAPSKTRPSYSDPRCEDPMWILDQAEKYGSAEDGVPEFLEAFNLKMPTEETLE